MNTHALLIGCEYHNTKHYLPGCIYDVQAMRAHLIKNFNLPAKNIELMSDTEGRRPTKENMLNALKKLIEKGNKSPCHLFFHYSGHGSRVPDMDGDEIDGFDECLIPLGLMLGVSSVITDDELHVIVNNLSKQSTLTIVTDCCHSGSCFDLKYAYKNESELKNMTGKFEPNIVKMSGCRDDQTSASILTQEANEKSRHWKGGLTISLLKYLKKESTWLDLYKKISHELQKRGLSQKPVLSCNGNGKPNRFLMT